MERINKIIYFRERLNKIIENNEGNKFWERPCGEHQNDLYEAIEIAESLLAEIPE